LVKFLAVTPEKRRLNTPKITMGGEKEGKGKGGGAVGAWS